MKILNKFIWSKKEPSNKNDIWFDGSTWRMYTEEAWQSFTLPVDAADTVVKMLENASEVYQEKLNAGYGIVIEGNTISLDMSSIDIDTTHNIGSIELFDQLIKDRSRYKLHEDDIKAIQEGKLITTTKFGTKIPVLSVNHMVQSSTSTSIVGYTLTFYVDAVLYNMSIYDFEIVGGLSWKTQLDSLAPDSNFISNSYNAIQNAIVTKKFEETDAKFTELEEQTTEQLAELSKDTYPNPFLIEKKTFNFQLNSYESNSAGCTTYHIKIGSYIKGKTFLGGTSYPTYCIMFFDADKNPISKYCGDKSGFQDFELTTEDIPSNAAYFIINNTIDYKNDSIVFSDAIYKYYNELEELKSTEGISEFVTIPFDKSGYYTRKGNFIERAEFANTGFFPITQNSKFVVFDSIEYDIAGLAFFDKNKTFISACNISSSSGVKEINLTSDLIPNNAKYFVASAQIADFDISLYRAILSSSEIVEFFVQEEEDTTETLPSDVLKQYRVVSTRSDIGIWLEDLPDLPSFYIKVSVSSKPSGDFSIYTADANKGNIKSYKTAVWDSLIYIEHNSEFPLLYIYKGGVPISDIEYTITVYTATSLERTTNELVSWHNKRVVIFGDSITEFKGDDYKRYSDHIQEYTGAEVINIGIGGTQFRQRKESVLTPSSSTDAYAALDIVNLVEACCTGDFSKQEAAAKYLEDNNIDYEVATIARAKTIDWSKVDVVTFFAGTNDWNNAPNSRGELTSKDINFTFGAINTIIQRLLTTYPHLQIYWFTPIVSWSEPRTDETWSDNKVKGGYTLKEFSAKIESVVKSHHIPICDLYNTLGWNKYNFSQYFSDNDGTHPDYGYDEIAHKMVAFINANRTF